ncbi:hypothetical protein GCM10023340_01010 [Nocardioides marinquilinus]|uniref:Protein kinase domain-containing protein n=1 Tax=Nocardioides marinquilinus TaxID=1210400 RepID=A0ABP9P4K8_9ACTN
MPHATRPGDVLGERYALVDLLLESRGGRFWRARDRILERDVAVHVIAADDPRADDLMEAARRSATVVDRRMLRVLDAEVTDELCYIVNEWGWGASLDIVVSNRGPLGPRRASWLVAEVADSVAVAHEKGIAHGRLGPENVLIDRAGGVRIIGTCVDAALHGVLTDDRERDVTDLAGLLYCALTARWAGASSSTVMAAPREHGQVLRPRRVRAGIPRMLDSLCDEVLDPATTGRHRELVDLDVSARGLADFLADYVGDPAGMPEALLESTPEILPEEEQVVLPPVPEIAPHDTGELPDDRHDDTGDTGALRDARLSRARAAARDVPTEAGVPIFGETDDVSWLERRTTPVPPPPPFEEPPERPLFAPEPESGAPARQAREERAARSKPTDGDGGFWPWASDTGTDGTGAGLGGAGTADTGGGRRLGGGGHGGTGDTEAQEPVPGRRWLLLATLVAVLAVVAVVVVVALNVGRDGSEASDDGPASGSTSAPTSGSTSGSGSPSPTAEPVALTGLTATALDPQGDGEENDDETPLAVDGDPGTSWPTLGYDDPLTSERRLKTGVGLLVDLGGERDVAGVDLRFVGAPTSVSVYLTDGPVDDVEGLEPAASGTADGEALELDAAGPATHVVVWLTDLPEDPSDGRYRARVAEVEVLGA